MPGEGARAEAGKPGHKMILERARLLGGPPVKRPGESIPSACFTLTQDLALTLGFAY